MTRDITEGEAAKELQAAAMAVTSDAAKVGNHLLLCRNADGTYAMRGRLSLAGVATLLRLLERVLEEGQDEDGVFEHVRTLLQELESSRIP